MPGSLQRAREWQTTTRGHNFLYLAFFFFFWFRSTESRIKLGFLKKIQIPIPIKCLDLGFFKNPNLEVACAIKPDRKIQGGWGVGDRGKVKKHW